MRDAAHVLAGPLSPIPDSAPMAPKKRRHITADGLTGQQPLTINKGKKKEGDAEQAAAEAPAEVAINKGKKTEGDAEQAAAETLAEAPAVGG